MKYLLFSDAHLGIHGSSEVWLQATQRLFEEIIETCKQESIEKILFLGDFFNDRRSLNLRAL
jgi:DNA repair exonuclease SbcCD nuclease subunit